MYREKYRNRRLVWHSCLRLAKWQRGTRSMWSISGPFGGRGSSCCLPLSGCTGTQTPDSSCRSWCWSNWWCKAYQWWGRWWRAYNYIYQRTDWTKSQIKHYSYPIFSKPISQSLLCWSPADTCSASLHYYKSNKSPLDRYFHNHPHL